LCAATRHDARKRPEYRRRPSAPAGAAVRHYQHTCQLEGLLDDDTLWRATMVDGVGTMRQLRDPFVMLS
jgi:hypothetical protein